MCMFVLRISSQMKSRSHQEILYIADAGDRKSWRLDRAGDSNKRDDWCHLTHSQAKQCFICKQRGEVIAAPGACNTVSGV